MQQLVFVVLDFELPQKEVADVIEAIKKIPGVASSGPVEQVVSQLLYEGHHDRRKYHGSGG